MKQIVSPSASGPERTLSASLAFLGLEPRPRLREEVEPDATLAGLLSRDAGPADAPARLFRSVVSAWLSDDERALAAKGRAQAIVGRDREADAILDTLVRIKARAPVLIAPPGSKSTIARRAVQRAIAGEYPQSRPYRRMLERAHWVAITPSRLLALASANNPAGRKQAVERFFDAALALEAREKIRIVVFIDDFHTLDGDQVEALTPYIDADTRAVSIVGACSADKFSLAFKDNASFVRRIRQIPVVEFSDDESLRILEQSWLARVEAHYGVRFSERARKPLVRLGTTLYPEGGKIDAGLKMAIDLAIHSLRRAGASEGPIAVEEDDAYAFFKARTGYPVNPFNPEELAAYVRALDAALAAEIVGQERMRRDLLHLFQDVIVGAKKDMGVIALLGPTGAGKSQIAKLLAQHGFQNPRALLRIDMTEYRSHDSSLNKLFGAVGGLVTSTERQGILCDWFDDPSQGKYGGVVLIDEAERGDPGVWERLMEFFDTGAFVGGDGRRRQARRHVVILTSNRGDTILFPDSIAHWSDAHLATYVDEIEETTLKRLFQMKLTGRDAFQIPTPVLNRIDRYTVAGPLRSGQAAEIVQRLAQRHVDAIARDLEVVIALDPGIAGRLADHHFSMVDGARPLERGVARFFNAVKERLQAGAIRALRGRTIELILDADNAADGRVRALCDGAAAFAVDLPRARVADPLLDPEFSRQIKRLRDILPSEVKGQDDAVERTIEALTSWLSLPVASRRPLGLFWVGPTGVGKTELARAVSLALFEARERAEIIPFGEVSNEHRLNQVIGSPPGTIGSDEVRAFERALRNMPDGGVLVFDEISNMGDTPATRDALFKRLYHPFEEGRWTSSATSETYDLSRYVIVLTGNDGEDFFKGTDSDPIREQIWRKLKAPDKVRRMLGERGVPQAFLGRMADVILFRPLTHAVAGDVAAKLVARILDRYAALGVETRVEDAFTRTFGDLFYTADKGARSLRDMATHRFNHVIATALAEVGCAPEVLRAHAVRLKLAARLPDRPFVAPDDPKPKVEFVVEILARSDGAPRIVVTKDYTQFAALPKRLAETQARATAYHEAGHAVVNDPALTGQKLAWLTILGDVGNLGFALYDEDDDRPVLVVDRSRAVLRLARLMAGQTAMTMAGFAPDAGWAADLRAARQLARRMILEWGLDPEFLGVAPAHDTGRNDDPHLLSERQIDRLSDTIAGLLAEALTEAEGQLGRDWDLVEALVAQLMANGSVSGETFDRLRAQHPPREIAGHAKIAGVDVCARLLVRAKGN
ncbi:ATP-dependent Clp protease ATP-binding subunit ClpA [Roseiarcus fermentans]|uniref:ATP-dependent Clp protease ATP-binding subunit ClpA n=1 Tax=Roseiarcus fermentans TaxID=1473586 RepID=A0A366FS59_9HYPH|nr:AAA family ATPase [Roseiarcus fermentans]RBP16890.1 ATP-dependent Clp protease ATP-binding subunit ClpA [Roseiarcus fermentans]